MEDISDIVSRVVNADYGHSRHVMPEQPWKNHARSSGRERGAKFY